MFRLVQSQRAISTICHQYHGPSHSVRCNLHTRQNVFRTSIRALTWSAKQSVQVQASPAPPTSNVVNELERSPIVQAVVRKMKLRVELQAKLMDNANLNTPEAKLDMRQLSELENLHEAWEEWKTTRELLLETQALLKDPDPTLRSLAEEEHASLVATLSTLASTTFPSLLIPPSTTSHLHALLEIKAGVGGSESALFAADLMRMYEKLAGGRSWRVSIMEKSETDNGGLKEVTLEVKGQERVYDVLRWESGVHRVQRVPETESSGRVHTSTAAVLVLPLEEDNGAAEKDDELFKMDEVKIEVMRSRGAGGQHVNKTESAVRLTHIPTGITVSMQDERSQHQNKRRAFQVLRARLMDRHLQASVIQKRDMRRKLVNSVDRSEKIRTYQYVQDRVTDHRIGKTVKGIGRVMSGEGLEEVLDALEERQKEEVLEEVVDSSGP